MFAANNRVAGRSISRTSGYHAKPQRQQKGRYDLRGQDDLAAEKTNDADIEATEHFLHHLR